MSYRKMLGGFLVSFGFSFCCNSKGMEIQTSFMMAIKFNIISFVLMLISLTNLAAMGKIQKNISTKVRLVGLININTKE